MVEELLALYERDLQRLHKEIAAFQQEAHLWQTSGHVPNAAGNLALHLAGNLLTYIGKNLGHTAYVRDREAEFSSKSLPQQALLEQIEATQHIVRTTLQQIKPHELSQLYPENILGFEMTTGFFLLHLLAHLSYHLGQINYLRRMLE